MTDIKFRPLFPSPLGYCNFGNANKEFNKKLIEDIEDHMSKDIMGGSRTFKKNQSSWQSDIDLEHLYESFSMLRDDIERVSKPILIKSGFKEENVMYSHVRGLWANVCFDVGGYAVPHIHGNGRTLWSGVYYPKGLQDVENLDDFNEDDYILLGYQPNNDGALVIFDNARVEKGLVLTEFDNREFYGSEIMVKPRESLLILFPVWLMHMVTPLTTNEKRYSISFAINKPM